MESLQTFLFVIQIIVSALLILIVLLQRSEEDALGGIGANASNAGIMPHKSTANILTRITMALFFVFMINSLLLATIAARNVSGGKGLVDKYIEENVTEPSENTEITIPEAK